MIVWSLHVYLNNDRDGDKQSILGKDLSQMKGIVSLTEREWGGGGMETWNGGEQRVI